MSAPSPSSSGAAAALFPGDAAWAAAAAPGGYAWWYVEVHDAAGRFTLALIVFAGSVFSPDYAAWRRAGAPVCGLDVPAVNFSLYERARSDRPSAQRAWVMSEYGREALHRDKDTITVARTALHFPPEGGAVIALDEDTTRFFSRRGQRVTGRITVAAAAPALGPLCLGENERGEAHYWQPLAPRTAATVDLEVGRESLRYSGLGYLDHNYGSGPLEDTFSRWGWAHGFATPEAAGNLEPSSDAAVIVYSATRHSGRSRRVCVRYPADNKPPEIFCTDHAPQDEDHPAHEADTPRSTAGGGREPLWLRVPRSFRAGPYTCRRLAGGMLADTPFYARFAVHIAKARPASAEPGFYGVGEYLDLERFRRPSLQYLLRYKTRCIRSGAAR